MQAGRRHLRGRLQPGRLHPSRSAGCRCTKWHPRAGSSRRPGRSRCETCPQARQSGLAPTRSHLDLPLLGGSGRTRRRPVRRRCSAVEPQRNRPYRSRPSAARSQAPSSRRLEPQSPGADVPGAAVKPHGRTRAVELQGRPTMMEGPSPRAQESEVASFRNHDGRAQHTYLRPQPPFFRPPDEERTRRICPELGICASKCVELGGIEPPSIRRWTPALRPFPASRLTQPHRRVGCSPVTRWATARLSERSAFFHAASVLSRRHLPLLLPGCGGTAPCGIAAHDDSRIT